jgi:amino acid adenylation domain-containing protein
VTTISQARADPELAGLHREWDDAVAPVPELTLPELFARRTAEAPGAIAVQTDDETVSYAELSARADRLARQLAGHGVAPGDNVAVLMRRSAGLVAAFLAVAKAGAAFVPLDPGDPLPRMRAMIAGSGCAVVMTDAATQHHEITRGIGVVSAAADDGPEHAAEPFADRTAGPDALLYIMHTSGSTGAPKGVAVTHRNVIALALDRVWRSGGHERVLFHSPHAFDASTYELWVPLLSGGRIVIASGDVDAVLLRKLASTGAITALWLTAGLFSALAEGDPGCLAGVREVWTGGDVVPRRAVECVAASCPGISVFNGYGPTETTTFATRYRIHPGPVTSPGVPIGTPMDNTRVYVLDDHFRLLPPGTAGQVYIAGAGVARGYVSRPGLTAQRFLPDPFGAPGERMYAAGDLARREESGDLSFLGRADDQVKIHGFRIEPSEIESVLTAHPDVSRAVVLAGKTAGGGGAISAFAVPAEPGRPPDPAQLRAYLAAALPAYMVPAQLTIRADLPLTRQGKVDRRLLAASVPPLPHPGAQSGAQSGARAAEPAARPVAHEPAPEAAASYRDIEERVTELWKTVLGLDHVGPDDKFFDRGGNSLKLIALHARLCRTFSVNLPVQRLFEISTIRTIARYLHAPDPGTAVDDGSARLARSADASGVGERGAARRSRIATRKDLR